MRDDSVLSIEDPEVVSCQNNNPTIYTEFWCVGVAVRMIKILLCLDNLSTIFERVLDLAILIGLS